MASDLPPGLPHPHAAVPPAPARRLASVLPPVIPQVGAWIAQRPGTLSLAQGMVSWGPPPGVRQALARAAAATSDPWPLCDHYGPMAGDGPLLEQVRRELKEHHGFDLEGTALLITAGSNMAFNAVAQVLLDPGDEVLLPVPWYFNHWMAIQLAGGVPVAVESEAIHAPAALKTQGVAPGSQVGALPDPERLAAAITPRTRAIVTVSPGNPSGLVTPGPVLAAINRLCAERGLWHISDEAYAAFVHGPEPHRSPATLPGSGRHTITLHSLSKAYGMAGWRLGYASVPRSLMAGLAQVQDTILICPPRPIQQAAVAALEAGPAWVAPRVASLEPRRTRVLEAVNRARERGLPLELVAEPDGAFYALLACHSPLSGEELVRRLVLEHGVALLPGEAFGLQPRNATAFLRLSYGMLQGEALEQALHRLTDGLAALAAGRPG